jgi:signal transduction histidine kinase
MPVQISIRPLLGNGFSRGTYSMVVTDLTESRRSEELLRSLTRRAVQAQEGERARVALELHDNITQLLCAIVYRSQALAGKLTADEPGLRRETAKIQQMLGKAANEVERISRNLRPGVLGQLGLPAVLRQTASEFSVRTGIAVNLACVKLTPRLPPDAELALYRILQESLTNIQNHAHAHRVTVRLSLRASFVQLTICDDGVGFDPEHPAPGRRGKRGLGLLSIRERAAYAGGLLQIESVKRIGTTIRVRIPCRRDPVG